MTPKPENPPPYPTVRRYLPVDESRELFLKEARAYIAMLAERTKQDER